MLGYSPNLSRDTDEQGTEDFFQMTRHSSLATRYFLCVLLSAIALLSGCGKTNIETRDDESNFRQQKFRADLDQFISSASRLVALTSQGVNLEKFSDQLATVSGSFAILDGEWPHGEKASARLQFQRAVDEWKLLRSVWASEISSNARLTELMNNMRRESSQLARLLAGRESGGSPPPKAYASDDMPADDILLANVRKYGEPTMHGEGNGRSARYSEVKSLLSNGASSSFRSGMNLIRGNQ